jgi:hypothetical protein
MTRAALAGARLIGMVVVLPDHVDEMMGSVNRAYITLFDTPMYKYITYEIMPC